MTTLHQVELGVLGPLEVRQGGLPVTIPGAKPRAILTMLGLHDGSVVSADSLVELLWDDDPPRTAAKALQTHISLLRRTLGDGFVLTQGAGWSLAETEVDAARYKAAARLGRDAAAAGDDSRAGVCFDEALALWRGIPELPDGRRGTPEKTRWIEAHAALVEDRADALLATGRAAEIVGELEAAVADAPLRERRWGQLMLALYRAGRQGEALGAYQRARSLLADELGVDPGPNLRRLEALVVAQDAALEVPVTQRISSVTRAVTFLLTDIEGSTAAWEANADAMAVALARHDEIVEQVITSRGGRVIKTRGEGDATFSVFERPSAAAAAALELQDAIVHEPWALSEPMRVRVALHTGEAELRDGDYFGRAVNRAARLRSLATGGQILCSGATAELVIDSIPDHVVLADLGRRELRNLARPEHVFELRLETAGDRPQSASPEVPMERPGLPTVLAGPGPFVGRGNELQRLFSAWQTALAGGTNAVLIAGEPGVGKTRLAGEWSRQAYDQGALVIYGRCDEDLGAPYQPFAEALRALLPCLGAGGLRGLRGVEALLALVPGLTDILPDLAAPTRADPDTERYALFDAIVAVLGVASASAPVVLILDDLHWAAKPTLLLLRHLLRFGEQAHVQVIGTYRSTDLDRSHPLAAMLADLHRDGSGNRIQLSGLDEDDVTAYVAEAGYNDEDLARALASVTGGNPFFLIEALRHVAESGGRWDQSTLPQGVREAVSRRLSRLSPETNKALAAAAVVGSRFALELVERVVGDDLVDAFDEARKAGIVIEEPGGRYRFNHALVRQSLLAELPSVRRMRLHQRIATTLENEPGADDEVLAELAYHYFECAWAGNAAKAVEYCRRAADQAMARLAYEGAAELYGRALHALEEIDDELPDRGDQTAELLIARCEALLAAGDVTSAAGAVAQLQGTTVDSARLAAWATCFDGQLSMLIHPERLDEAEAAVGAAAAKLAELDDAAGEAKAHTVRAGCLARLGRIGDCEVALDDALTAARRAREHRRVNNVLANAPLAALWGPNPVPRAGGRCLDVVRLLRITTDSPAVEATSTRCQAVLEAFRGRAAAARRMIDSARRTVTELGLRHALLEVEQFAGIVELVVDDPAAAEPHLLKAYNGFRRMGLDADTAETAALLGRACLALDRDAEADQLCVESERLAGHALKPSIAWRTLRARLLSRSGDHAEARRIAEDAVSLAERTDALVDHGDACATLATVLGAAGDVPGARAAAERAVGLYERKGAAALAEKARSVLGGEPSPVPTPPEAPDVELDNAAARVGERVMGAIHRQAWDELERLFAPTASIESRRKVVGLTLSSDAVRRAMRREIEMGTARISHVMVAARGERLALSRLITSTPDTSPGAPQDELLQLYAIDEQGRVAQQVWFDVEDIDAALAELDATHARLEEERPKARRLENAASHMFDRMQACFTARDWDALAGMLVDGFHNEDRRRVVNAGVQRGRDAAVETMRWAADLGITHATSTVIATRGGHLVLAHARYAQGDENPETFQADALQLAEIDGDERLTAIIVFDAEDFEAAIAELDARYLAGEAADHSQTWSAVLAAYGAINRRELPATTPDFQDKDHRRGAAFAPGDMVEYLRAGWDLDHDIHFYIEAVHRLSDLGAVVTHKGRGASPAGFDAEWREVMLFTADGDSFNRCEVFDGTDIDAAAARFDQLSRPTPRLENAAARVFEHVWSHFASRNWDALAETVASNYCGVDRRRVVSAEIQHDRDDVVRDLQAAADVGFTISMVSAIAIRGKRLVLARVRASGRDPEAIQNDALNVVEVDVDDRIAHVVTFDLEDFDAAIAELDARYLAGEATAHANVLQPVMDTVGELNRHEPGPMLGRLVYADHRRVPFGSAEDYGRAIEELWTLVPDARYWTRAVHVLDAHGLVSTLVIEGTDAHANELQWGRTFLFLSDGPRVEVYEEDDVDVALARFEESRPQARRLDNTASQVSERHSAHFAARDWDALATVLADDFVTDDRRRAVNAGIRHGRDAEIANMQAAAEVGITYTAFVVIAARGERLILTRASVGDGGSTEFAADVLSVVEINSHNQISAFVIFELDDFDSAIAELDARYLAGEAAAHAHTWSVITGAYAALNRREYPATAPDWVSIDHRRGISFPPGAISSLLANWNATADRSNSVEAVHRLTDLGAVLTSVTHESSPEGFQAEWRGISVLTIEGDLIDRLEVFDEADLEAALARFEELHSKARRPENAATRVYERLQAYYVARDWTAITKMLSDDHTSDDRRAVVGTGIQRGRDALIENLRAVVDVGITNATSDTIATRGGRLALTRARYSRSHEDLAAFHVDYLQIVEIDADERITLLAALDPDNFGAAIAELDARYLAGEAAAHSHAWSIIAASYAALSRHEMPLTTPDCVNIDHRRETAFGPGDVTDYIRAGWPGDQDINVYVEEVHRLNNHGAAITYVAHETSRVGFDAEWCGIAVLTVDGEMVNRVEVFDETDLDAALVRFEDLHPQAQRLENAASQSAEQFLTHFAAGDWDAMAKLLADNYALDDRRQVVGAGVRRGRDAQIVDLGAIAEVWITNVTSTVIAIRGERLVLMLVRHSSSDQRLEAFHTEALVIGEINADERIVGAISFDPDDIEAAFEELDERYLAGEAATHAHTWAVVSGAYAAMNRHELFATTPDWVNRDHRRPGIIEDGGLNASLASLWELIPGLIFRIEAVHRLTDLGAVCSHVAQGVSRDGFAAEWRGIEVITTDRHLINRCEIFDAADLDAAIAHFEELHLPTRLLENAASQVVEQFSAYFAVRNWDAMEALLAADVCTYDRRRVVNDGLRRGRDVEMANWRATADVWLGQVTSTVIATRGKYLALFGLVFTGQGRPHEAFSAEALVVVEINHDNRIATCVVFDTDDIDAAFVELDARYLAGEAAPYARVWKSGMDTVAELNRHEPGPRMRQLTYIDHRRVPFASGADFGRGVEELWELVPDAHYRVTCTHALDSRGTVVTFVIEGTDKHGNELQWRRILLFASEGPCLEVYEEEDLDAALARFDELRPESRRHENAATRVDERFWKCYAARDWYAMAEMLTDDICTDDRRRVVNAGLRHGRVDHIAEMRAVAEMSTQSIGSTVLATRGERLALTHVRVVTHEMRPEEVSADVLNIVEIGAGNRIVARIGFDIDEIDAAFEELDARYLAGEAAAYSQTWTAMTQVQTVYNRHEFPPTTKDFVNNDHRRGRAFSPDDVIPFLRASYNVVPNLKGHIEAVHRLSDFGVVVTEVMTGTSQEGFEAEWREIGLFAFDGELVCRFELFDETDLDTALARFEQLRPEPRRLENAASRVHGQLKACVGARDWNAVGEILSDDIVIEDRRRAVNSGIQYGRAAAIADMRSAIDLGLGDISLTVIATRGDRLELSRMRVSHQDQPEAFGIEFLSVLEINADERIVARIGFEIDDIDAAFDELDAHYAAGEAANHADTWSVVANVPAQFNRHELFATAPGPAYIDHRRLVSIEGVDLAASVRAVWDITSDSSVYIEAVHRLNERGAVFTEVLKMTSRDGFDAEVWMIMVFTVEGGLISRVEVFDEQDLDAALARFDELHPEAPRLENAASQAVAHFWACLASRDWAAMAETMADDFSSHDHRRVVNAGVLRGRDVNIANMRAVAEVGFDGLGSTVIATRGQRLALARIRSSAHGFETGEISADMLGTFEIGADNRFSGGAIFDADDIDAAFEDLDARYLAGEAAAHAHTWSVIAGECAAFNRHELPAAEWATIDHRSLAVIDAREGQAAMRDIWEVTPNLSMRIEAVHRLSSAGTVSSYVASGTSPEGLDAEWPLILLLTLEGDRINRCEIFDEEDLDAALTRYDELQPPHRRLGNSASRLGERFFAHAESHEWDAMAEIVAEDSFFADRRRVVNVGVWHGRDAVIANMRVLDEIEANMTLTVIATRGERLALTRVYSLNRDLRHGEFEVELLSIVETDADNRIAMQITFDPNDIDIAFAELDDRYLAGEAAPYSHTWSVIRLGYGAFNRREQLPTTADWVNIDHRRALAVPPGEMTAYVHAAWDLEQEVSIYIEVAHRLSNLGAVVTHATYATSRQGFQAEWRIILVLKVDGDMVNHCEIFDEADLGAALARFDELDRPTLLENAATRIWSRLADAFDRRDLDGFFALTTADLRYVDRRRGLRDEFEGPARRKNMQAMFDAAPSGSRLTVDTIAIRGPRFSLTRAHYGDPDDVDGPTVDMLQITEVNPDGLMSECMSFDPDDIDGAFAELTARWIGSGEAAHPNVLGTA